jgi:hypothetical protein
LKEKALIETLRITSARAAAVFAAARQRKILLSLIERERSPSELGRLTDTPLNLLHYHVGTLLRLGLVRVARIQARAGAPIKYYRAVARSFFVPAELLRARPGVELAARLRERLEKGLAGCVQGVHYSHDGVGPRMRVVEDAGRGSFATEIWLELRLSAGDASEMDAALRALLRRFDRRSQETGRRYLVHAAFAPVQHVRRPRSRL